MDLGLYELKYQLRQKLTPLLPLLRGVDPSTISWLLLPIGAITALLYAYAPQASHYYLYGIFFILVRLVIGTLDGMLAEETKRCTEQGAIINRLAPELCDVMLLAALAIASPTSIEVTCVALVIAHLTSFLGLVGLVGGEKVQSVGPVGQTDRLVALALFSLLAAFAPSVMTLFFYWLIIGGAITCLLRGARLLQLLQS